MNIDKAKLTENFKKKNWNYVFASAYKISDFLCSKVYNISNTHDKEDMVQECVLNFHKKIMQNKVDENNNLFSFIYTNSNFRILEMLRKERNRRNIAPMVSYEEMLETAGEHENTGEVF